MRGCKLTCRENLHKTYKYTYISNDIIGVLIEEAVEVNQVHGSVTPLNMLVGMKSKGMGSCHVPVIFTPLVLVGIQSKGHGELPFGINWPGAA